LFNRRSARACLCYAALCSGLLLSWQYLTVRYNYNDDWTALFHTGSALAVPAALTIENIYTFADSRGYDGQFYHLIAHDPWLRAGFSASVDNPRLRWRRILTPGLAYLAAGGQAAYIHASFVAVTLGFLFLGTYWLSRYCACCHQSPAWGVCFAAVPAVVVSIDRLTIDLALASLCVGFALYAPAGRSGKLYPLLVLAPLARETGLCLVAACCLSAALERQWMRAARLASTVAPYLAWAWFVHRHTAPDQTLWASWIPLQGILNRTLQPAQYAVTSQWLAKAAVYDYLALLGIWLSFALAFRQLWKNKSGVVEIAAALFALFAMLLARADIWHGAYEFGRTMSPLLVWLGLLGLSRRYWWNLLPLAMFIPRLALQLQPQWSRIVSSWFAAG